MTSICDVSAATLSSNVNGKLICGKIHTHLIVVNCGFSERLKERAASHSKSANHLKKEKDSRQPSVSTSFARQSGNQNTWKELIETLVTADVPLYKLDDEKLRKVL